MPKVTLKDELKERMLYETYLDLFYAEGLSNDYVNDLAMTLKESKRINRKIKKNLEKAELRYKEIHGTKPMKPKV